MSVSEALADHVSYQDASVNAREIAPAPDGGPRVRVSWEIKCSGAQLYGGSVFLYSYRHDGPIAAVTEPGAVIPATGQAVTSAIPGPGRYRPHLVGVACVALVADEDAHTALGPPDIRGPDFEVCAGAQVRRTGSGRSWPLIPIGGSKDPCAPDCETRASSASAWPLIPVPKGCEPKCQSRSSASRRSSGSAWPLIPVPGRERCAPERVTKRNEAPVPIKCPGGTSASNAWPVLPVNGPCSGQVELKTSNPVPCASAAGWPVVPVPCAAAVRRKRIVLGSARFRLRAGRAGVVLVKLRPNARRLVKRSKRVRVRATIRLRKGKRRARTVRQFTLRAR